VTSRLDRTMNYAILVFFCVVAVVPIIGIATASLNTGETSPGGFALPDGIHLGSYSRAWDQGGFGHALQVSAFITGTTVVASTALSILSGYAFGTMRFRGANALFYVFLIGLIMPFEATIVPLYYDLRQLGLVDTYWAVILPSVALSCAFGTFWMRAYFLAAPRSLVEAARIDGARSWTVLWRVLLPLGRPAVLTMVVLIFMWTWNDFLLSLVMLSDESQQTAPLRLAAFQGQHQLDIPGAAAASVIVSAPVLIVYVLAQRHFIRGMLGGAIKA
jgi:raffinose/stachyose/melibiose transport system permease protein